MHLPTLLALAPFTLALPTTTTTLKPPTSTPLPLIIWHGLGDRYDADGLASVSDLAQSVHAGTHVYMIRNSDDGSADSRATFFGNLTTQLDTVCATLTNDTSLHSNTTRIDALGFSQGGQFLRGLVERCPGIAVRSLVTFGSQHNGIAKFQECGTWDLLCKGAIAAVRGNAWSEFVQGSIVPPQYYREVNETTGEASAAYLNGSNFLADVNNERDVKSEAYKRRLASLDKFAMYVFEDDKTVIPKESGWFAHVNATSGNVTHLRDRKIYKEDWVGLKELDRKDGLVFRSAPGEHMRLTDKVLSEAFRDFFGPERDFGKNETRTEEGVLDSAKDGPQEVQGGFYEL